MHTVNVTYRRINSNGYVSDATYRWSDQFPGGENHALLSAGAAFYAAHPSVAVVVIDIS